ncbi:transcriptional coactivator/pterin dehydratase [Pleomassaria siparia CBS 279.74]|uniref:4a-hydroxytetrahydrobiopterin dehydratase n=1 Tax=Pleomassaria siparia CBS 279.74 TaxID=1314801 RepID=A0A6G1KHY5_9PLEO|nr:transcriptional coactivator/pterin dehydratase [Pleomassaria siparia CBS 279.74]
MDALCLLSRRTLSNLGSMSFRIRIAQRGLPSSRLQLQLQLQLLSLPLPLCCTRPICQPAATLDHQPRFPRRLLPQAPLLANLATGRTSIRNFSTGRSSRTNSESAKHAVGEPSHIIFAENQAADLPGRVSELLSVWTISPSRKGLIRHFTFPSFSKAFSFMTLVAAESKAKRHHPSWHNVYNTVTVEWTTHDAEGMSSKDVDMAEFCNRTAERVGLKKQ